MIYTFRLAAEMRRNKSDSPYALTDLQLRLEGDLLGRGAMLDLPHQQLDALESDLLAGLDDGGHHRHAVAGHRDAVEADDRYIFRHPEPGAHQRPDGTESDDIAHGEQSGELGPAGQQAVHGVVGRLEIVVGQAVEPVVKGEPGILHGILCAEAAHPTGVAGGRTAENCYLPVALRDEVGDGGAGRSPVIHAHHREVREIQLVGDQRRQHRGDGDVRKALLEVRHAAAEEYHAFGLYLPQDLLGGVQLTWAEYGQPIVQSAALALENLQGIFTTLWQNVLQPILTNLMEILSTLWSSHLKPLWDDILLLVASVANCLLDLWNNLLAPVAKWIIATFGPAFAEVFNAIADVVGVAVGAIADAIDLAIVVLRGLADFLSAVFRGNWNAAWQAIGNTVNTVWDKMTNAIKTAVNGIIGFINRMISAVVTGINAVINALNGLSFDLPDIFGGGHVGFNISTLTAPQIPYLAQGAVIPANREFLAVLGDQNHGTNVEAPLDTIKQAVAEVMEDLQAGQMAGFEAVVSVLREILSAVYGIELTDEDVGHAVQRWQRKQLTATGGV